MATSNNGGDSNTSGGTTVVFGYKSGKGCVPDPTMAEIVARLTGSVDLSGESGYVRSAKPPTDLTATWVPVDGNGNRTGNNKVYNPVIGEWVDDFGAPIVDDLFISEDAGNQIKEGADGGLFVAPLKFYQGTINVAGDGTQTLTFTAMGAEAFDVSVEPKSDVGPGSNLRYYIESVIDGTLKLKFLGFDGTIVPSVIYLVTIKPLF